MKKILYITYDGLTDPVGEAQILPYIKELSNKFSFFVISFEKKENLTEEKIKKIKSYNFVWYKRNYHKKPYILSTLFDLFVCLITATYLVLSYKIKVIHCRSYVTSLIGLFLKKFFKCKFIFDMRGFWADERVSGKIWNLNYKPHRIVYSFFKKKEKEFFYYADKIISLTNNGKRFILENFCINDNKIEVIPCSVNYDFFNPTLFSQTQKNKLKEELGIFSESIVLCYAGSTGEWYLFDKMIEFFKFFKKNFLNSCFLMLLHGDLEKIKRIINNLNISNHILIKNVAYEAMNYYLSIVDFGIFFLNEDYPHYGTSPTKFSEFCAMNIPVICNKIGDLQQHINEIGLGFCLNTLNEENFLKIIEQIKNEYEKILEFRNNNVIRNRSRLIYDYKIAIEKYSNVYKTIE